MRDDYTIQQIKASVKMGDIIAKYGFEVGRNKRIPCPFHGGVDNNLGFKDDYFHCFVCGAKGDVITFVQKYFNIGFQSAVEKICTDFSLPFGRYETLSLRDRERMGKASFEARKAREAQIKLVRDAEDDYFTKMVELARLEDILIKEKPRDGSTELSPAYADALRDIGYARYAFEEAERRMRSFE
jgi:DNA primase